MLKVVGFQSIFFFRASCKSTFLILCQSSGARTAVLFISRVNVGTPGFEVLVRIQVQLSSTNLEGGNTACLSTEVSRHAPFQSELEMILCSSLLKHSKDCTKAGVVVGSDPFPDSSWSSLAKPTYSFQGMVTGNYATLISYI